MYDFGDHCIIAALEDAEYFGVYCAPVGEPACRDEVYDCASDALDYIFASSAYNDVRKWYNGHEIMFEFSTIDDLYNQLVEHFEDVDDEYENHSDLRETLGLTEKPVAEPEPEPEVASPRKYTLVERRAHLKAACAALDADLLSRPSIFAKLDKIEELEDRARAEPYMWHSERVFDELHHCMDTASYLLRVELTERKLAAYYEAHENGSPRVYVAECNTVEEAKAALLKAVAM